MLVFIIFILASLLISISAMLSYVSNTANFYKQQFEHVKGFYAAEDGIQYPLHYIKENHYYNIDFSEEPPYLWTDTPTFEGTNVTISIYDPAYEDLDHEPWDPEYNPVSDPDFDPEADVVIYHVTSEATIGEGNLSINAIIKRRIYSAVESEEVDGSMRLIFKRYKQAKILEISY